MSAFCDQGAPSSTWQSSFLAILPAIECHARRAVLKCPLGEREEALQFIIASTAIAFARLEHRNRVHLAYPVQLVRYGLKQFRAGRRVGGSANSHDVSSRVSQKKRGYAVQSLDDWQEGLAESRGMTPADLAALRIDFAAWLATLSRRNQQLATTLATGEGTGAAAKLFRMTAGRVSQLRRELYESWQRFTGEHVGAPS